MVWEVFSSHEKIKIFNQMAIMPCFINTQRVGKFSLEIEGAHFGQWVLLSQKIDTRSFDRNKFLRMSTCKNFDRDKSQVNLE